MTFISTMVMLVGIVGNCAVGGGIIRRERGSTMDAVKLKRWGLLALTWGIGLPLGVFVLGARVSHVLRALGWL